MIQEIKDIFATDQPILELTEEQWAHLTVENVKELVSEDDTHKLIKLPAREVQFFEWLKVEAKDVWSDLWGEDQQENLYTVSTALLPEIVVEHRGFPVCDLQTVPNFYFTANHFLGEQGKHYMDAIHERRDEGEKLTVSQVFALEVERAPIDKWRFAYMYELPISSVDECIRELVEDEVLTYTGTRDELSDYLDFEE